MRSHKVVVTGSSHLEEGFDKLFVHFLAGQKKVVSIMDEEYDVIVLGTGLTVKNLKILVLVLKNWSQLATFVSSNMPRIGCHIIMIIRCLQLQSCCPGLIQVLYTHKLVSVILFCGKCIEQFQMSNTYVKNTEKTLAC